MVTMIRSDLDFILAQIKIAEADARHELIQSIVHGPRYADPTILICRGACAASMARTTICWQARSIRFCRSDLSAGHRAVRHDGSGGLAFGPPITNTGWPTGTPIDFGFRKAVSPAGRS